MNNFSYCNPTQIHFGRGVIGKLHEELQQRGIKKVLWVYGGGSIRRNGVFDAVAEQLSLAGVTVIEHGGVQGNPVLSHVRQGIELATSNEVDLVLGVGGGSVVDSAKAIALGAAASCDVWDFFTKTAKPERALPVMAVLTLPATGSEMNGICVVTREETDEKFAVVAPGVLNPQVSFMDPETTQTLSMEQTAYACTDILSHVMEAYLTTSSDHLPVNDRQIEGVALACMESMDVLLEDSQNYEARASFMWCATLAWSGICQVGMPNCGMPNHALEMPLSAVYGIAHGAGLSIVIPAWIRIAGDLHAERILKLGRTILGVDCSSVGDVADALITYYRKIGSPVSCREAGIELDVERLSHLAHAAFIQRGMTDYTLEKLITIFEAMR